MMRDRRYGGDKRGYGGESRGYRGDGRIRSPTPPRRFSPPPGRYRDRGGYSPPRRWYDGDVEKERRGSRYARRDFDRHSDLGSRDYDHRNYSRGDKGSGGRDYDVDFSRGGRGNARVYDRNFIRGDRGYEKEYDRNFSRIDRGDRGNEREYDRNFSSGDRNKDNNFRRGGVRMSSYNFVDRGRDYGNRARDFDDGRSHQSGGNVEYSQSMYGASKGTSSKFRWDRLLDETKNSYGSSMDNGIGGSGVRSDLNSDYQSSEFLDKGRDGLGVDDNPVPVEPERGGNYSSSYSLNASFPASNVDAIGSGMAISSLYLPSGPLKDEDFHFHDKVHINKLVAGAPVMRDPLARESYEDKFLHCSSTDTDYNLSSSRLKGFDLVTRGHFKENISSSLKEDASLPSDGIRRNTRMMTNSLGYNSMGEKSRPRSPLGLEGRFGDLKSYPQSYLGNVDENRGDYNYPQVGSDEAGPFPRLTETYRNNLGIGEDYNVQDVSRLDASHPIGDKADVSSYQGYPRGSGLLDQYPTSLGLSFSDRYNAQQSFHANMNDTDDQGYRDPQLKYAREVYYGPGSSLLGDHNHDAEVVGSPRFHHRQSDTLPSREHDPHLGDIDAKPHEELMMQNVSLSKPYDHMLKRKYAEKQFSDHGNTNYVPRYELWSEDGNFTVDSKSLRVNNSKYGKSRKALDMVVHHQSPSGTVSFSSSSNLRKSHISGTRDIKKRLGPVVQKVHVSQRLVKKYNPSLKKRLGPRPQKNRVTLPWLKNLAPNLARFQDDSGGSTQIQGEDLTPPKPEPPENSEDFKQLVKIAFFKLVKQLNETPAKRRKYKEQGIAGSLKCIVCRSQEEFIGSKSLATHALTCQKLGLRSRHLGFHKALCALMGWKSAEKSNDTWLCETLTDVENMVLKEDLILWPPVVIIHNSTIGNKNPDQQITVTIEELEAKLRDMGFGDKTKVYRGKPANQSVMVVEFAGTLSGLQEAVRLNKFFVNKSHGRAEFIEVKSCSNKNHGGETESTPVNRLTNILYGYLGVAEDLDKLDFDAKKRRLVKSKKEIEDIAEAPIKT